MCILRPVDPTIATTVITGAAGLSGALIGSLSTLWAGRLQHKRTLASEREKQIRTHEVVAAQRATALLLDLDRLESSSYGLEGEEWTRYTAEAGSLRSQVRLEILYLPAVVREEVELCLNVVREAESLFEFGLFYWRPYSIAHSAIVHAQDVLAATVRGDSVPRRSVVMSRIVASMDDLDAELRENIYADEERESRELEREWLARHPQFASNEDPESRSWRLFRRQQDPSVPHR
jgi:hypothetical protein